MALTVQQSLISAGLIILITQGLILAIVDLKVPLSETIKAISYLGVFIGMIGMFIFLVSYNRGDQEIYFEATHVSRSSRAEYLF